jgi:DNA-binding LacI/PurR family transcriptional regulator
MRDGRTQTLGLVVSSNVPELMDTAEQVADKLGYALLIQFTYLPDVEAEQRALQVALERRVDGLIWQPTGHAEEYGQVIRQLRGSSAKLVMLQRSLPELSHCDLVYSDTASAARQVVAHLHEQGYQRLVYVTRSLDQSMRQQRLADFQAAAPEGHYIELHPSQQQRSDLSASLKQFTPPVAFYCDSDFDTVDVMAAAQSLGWRVPEDVGVVGLNDMLLGSRMRFGEITTPTVSAVRRHHDHIARRCVELLYRQLHQTNSGESAASEICAVQPTLTPRASTNRLRRNLNTTDAGQAEIGDAAGRLAPVKAGGSN